MLLIGNVCSCNTNMVCANEVSNTLEINRGVHYSATVVRPESNVSVRISPESCNAATNYEWIRSSNDDHNNHMPTYTIHKLNKESFKRVAEAYNKSTKSALREGAVKKKVDRREWERALLLSVVKEKRKSLPSSFYVANCHILINNERANHFILPLIREKELDKVASRHARHMIDMNTCEHSDIKHLISTFSNLSPWRRIGENVCCGKSIQAIHNEIIKNPDCIADKNNMYDRRFSSFGVGIATSSEGVVYICQIYKG